MSGLQTELEQSRLREAELLGAMKEMQDKVLDLEKVCWETDGDSVKKINEDAAKCAKLWRCQQIMLLSTEKKKTVKAVQGVNVMFRLSGSAFASVAFVIITQLLP